MIQCQKIYFQFHDDFPSLCEEGINSMPEIKIIWTLATGSFGGPGFATGDSITEVKGVAAILSRFQQRAEGRAVRPRGQRQRAGKEGASAATASRVAASRAATHLPLAAALGDDDRSLPRVGRRVGVSQPIP